MTLAVSYFNLYPIKTYADEISELNEYLNGFNNDVVVTKANITNSNPDYIEFDYCEKSDDFGKIVINTDSYIDFNSKELIKLLNVDNDEVKITTVYSAFSNNQILNVNFKNYDYESNFYNMSVITDYLKNDYDIQASYICTDVLAPILDNKMLWNKLYIRDEFGIETLIQNELSNSKIQSLNNEFKENNYGFHIDSDTTYFDENISDIKRIEFALWLKKEYNMYFKIISNGLIASSTYKSFAVYHTEKAGDVNNDNNVNINDAVLLSRFILGYDVSSISDYGSEYYCFNSKNADLNHDGNINVFDLVILKNMLIEK